MGSVETVGYSEIIKLLPFLTIGMGIIIYLVNDLNLLTLGDNLATGRGMNVERSRKLLFLATLLIVSSVVALCGPIGFVGMMAPHISRMLIGANHRYLFPATLFFGGSFLVICDTLARTLIAPAEIPAGVITAMIGGPFVLWLLFRKSSHPVGENI